MIRHASRDTSSASGATDAAAPPVVTTAQRFARRNFSRFVAELQEFVRIPSVSGQPRHARDVRECAQWLANHLRRIGMPRVEIVPTRRHPVVLAEHRQAAGRPTVLVYGHYDVQPAEPESAWRTPPFTPTIVGDDLHGRGACDDKGQLFTHVKALESLLRTSGALPVNVVCLFEGEEEIGSPNLASFLTERRDRLRPDVAVMSDTRMLAKDRPAITYALRGGLGLELEVRGPPRDLHSGNFGGAIHNPLQGLCELIGRLHDRRGRVLIPGFYRRVRDWGTSERARMAEQGPSDSSILRAAHVVHGWGEHGFSLYERTTIRPALTINGLSGGYQGPGGKAIIPSRALAKISLRLVPDQDPREIERLFREHIARLAPPTLDVRVRTLLRAAPAYLDRCHPSMRAARIAYRHGFGASPVFVRSGGTIPVVNMFQSLLGVPTVLLGFALPTDRIHAPDERFHLPNFQRGIATVLRFLHEIARPASSSSSSSDSPPARNTRRAP